MPTENRSSNTEQMVSVPASKLKKIHRDLDACQKVIWLRGGFDPAYCKDAQDSLKDIDALLAQPAAQHLGEPVALPERKPESVSFLPTGWNACLDEIAKLGPLYRRPVHGDPLLHLHPEAVAMLRGERKQVAGGLTYSGSSPVGGWTVPLYAHADAGEIEIAREMLRRVQRREEKWALLCSGRNNQIAELRAQLADAHALLREALKALPYGNAYLGIERALSASADSAPTSDGFSAGDMADQGAKAFAARDGEVQELRAKLAESHALLQRCVMAVREQHCDEGEADFDLPVELMTDIDAVLAASADKEWRMNPCKQGHRDVGAAGGTAHCYTCGEEIVAATTQEAFEKWNATHPAAPKF